MIPVIITPINPATGAPAVGISAAGISGNAPQVPAAVAALPPGSYLEGFVLNRDSAGNPTLRTSLGDFLLQSNFFLKIGSSVVVRVDATGSHFRAHIVEVDGEPVAPENRPANNTAPQQEKPLDDRIVRSQWLPVTNDRTGASNPTDLNAILLSPNTNAAAAGLKAGAALLVKLFNLQLPLPVVSPANAPALGQPATSPTATATTSYANQAYNPSGAATAGNPPQPAPTLPLTVTSTPANVASAPDLPDSPIVPSPQNVTASQNALQIPKEAMQLSVIGQERDGEPVLQTPFGLIKVTSGVTLTSGTKLQATLSLAGAEGSAALLATPDESTPLTSLAQKWTSLTQIFQLLMDAHEGALPATLVSHLPQLQTAQGQVQVNIQNAGAGLFLFLAALNGGDFKSIIGEKDVRLLEKLGQTSLLNRAENEFGMLARLASQPPQQGWQTMFLPVLVNGQVEMMRWFTKREREKDKDGKERLDGVTRFIVEVTMSQLGDIQLDGLFKKHANNQQFELVVRSHLPLDAGIQQEIQQIYQEAQSVTGVKGSVIFVSAERFPPLPLEDILGNPPDVFA